MKARGVNKGGGGNCPPMFNISNRRRRQAAAARRITTCPFPPTNTPTFKNLLTPLKAYALKKKLS